MIKLNVNEDEENATGHWTLNLETKELKLSPALAVILKTKRSSFKSLDEALTKCHPDFRDTIQSSINKSIKEKCSVVLDFILNYGQNQNAWVRTTVSPIESPAGSVYALTGVARDITREVNLELRNKTLLDALDKLAIISTCDTEGKIVHANESFLKATGYKLEELMGADHRLINSGLHARHFFKQMWSVLKSGKDFHSEMINKNKNGELMWVEAHVYPIKDFRSVIKEYISLRFDITEKKKMQKNELTMAKFHAVGETSAQIMHDVMNPLSIIQANIKILQKKAEMNEPIDHDYLLKKTNSMNEASQRIVKIFKNMKDLLDDHVETENSDLIKHVLKAIEVLELKINKVKVDVRTTALSNEQVFVRINSQQLLQVLINLISNSCDAIETLNERWIDFEIKHRDNYAVLSVRDSGAGIPPDIQPKIFESLFTTKGSEKGTGLGLSVCKRILEKNEGRIMLNTAGPHTQFDLYLLELQEKKENMAA